jgi:hypothetical protein
MLWPWKNKPALDDGFYAFSGIVPFYSQRLHEENYATEGFASIAEAVHWSERICGLACLKMAASALLPEHGVPSLKELLDSGLAIGAYREDVGWLHRGLIRLGGGYGLKGDNEAVGDNLFRIASYIARQRLVIASVTVGFEAGKVYSQKDGSHYAMPRGGHLVLIYGVTIKDGKVESLTLHHPSSDKDYERPSLVVQASDFARSFSTRGNIMYFWK